VLEQTLWLHRLAFGQANELLSRRINDQATKHKTPAASAEAGSCRVRSHLCRTDQRSDEPATATPWIAPTLAQSCGAQ